MRDLVFLQHAIKGDALDRSSTHSCACIALEAFSVGSEILSGLLVERIGSIRLEEEELHANDDSIEVENWFPVLSQDVETDVALEIDVWMVDLLCTLHFGRLQRSAM